MRNMESVWHGECERIGGSLAANRRFNPERFLEAGGNETEPPMRKSSRRKEIQKHE